MKQQQLIQTVQRYGIRKFNQGVASVMIASGLFFLGQGAVSANEVEANTQTENVTTTVIENAPTTRNQEKINTEAVNASALESTITKYEEKIAAGDYASKTEESLANFQAVIEAAKRIAADGKSTQREVDAARNAIITATSLLKSKPLEKVESIETTTDKETVGYKAENTEPVGGTNSIVASGSNDPRNGQSLGKEGDALRADTTSTTPPLTSTELKTIEENAKEKNLKVGEGTGVQFDKNTVVTPGMDDPNGAKAEDTPAPDGLVKNSEEGRFNLGFLQLNWFNQVNYPDDLAKKYYFRMSGSVNPENSDVKVELMDKEKNEVLEAHTLNQKEKVDFTALQKIYEYLGVKAQGSSTTAQPAKSQPIVVEYQTNTANEDTWGRINATYTREGDSTVNQIGNQVIPKVRVNNTYYRVQSDGRLLAVYSLLASTDEKITPSGVRHFTGYKYVNTENGGKVFDLENAKWQMDIATGGPSYYGVKRLVKFVKSDGTVVKSVWYKDPTYTGATTNDEDTTGYIKILETDEMKPGEQNSNINIIPSKTSTGEDFITEEKAKELTEKVNEAMEKASNGIANAVDIIVYQNADVTNIAGSKGVTVKIGFNGQTTTPNTIAGAPLIPGRSLTVTTAQYDAPDIAIRSLLSVVLYNDKTFAAEATHYYVPAGSVVVKYIDAHGNTIYGTGKEAVTETTGTSISKDGQTAVDNEEITSTAKKYDTTTQALRPNVIVTEDGSVYYYKEISNEKSTYDNNTVANTSDDTAADATGEVKQGLTTVTYVYEKAGNVVVKYITTDGTKLEGDVTFDNATTTTNVPTTGVADETNAKPDSTYSTADHKPTTITTADGKMYKLVTKAGTTTDASAVTYTAEGVATGVGHAAADGKVISDATQTVTYVYEEVKGNVVVKYETKDGQPLTGELTFDTNTTTTTVPTSGIPVSTNESGGTAYDTAANKPSRITTADGKVYQLVAQNNGLKDGSAAASGKVVADQTLTVTYVYEEVQQGSLKVEYYDTKGNKIATDKSITGDVNTPYDATTETYQPKTIKTADGKVYYYQGIKQGSATTKGTLTQTPQTVQYEYVQAGNVIVKYVIEGTTTELQAAVNDETNQKPGEAYTTTDHKPKTIKTADGSVYELVEKTYADETGTVREGETITVTYEYRRVSSPTPQNGGGELPTPKPTPDPTPTPTPSENITTSWVTEDGKELKPVESGKHPRDTFEGYEFVETVEDANGNTVHIYKAVETVITEWKTEQGISLKPSKNGTHEKDAFEGYEYVATTVDEQGNTTHVYRAIAQAEIPQSMRPELPNTGTGNDAGMVAVAASALVAGFVVATSKKKEEDAQ